jgi:hypothetical protein
VSISLVSPYKRDGIRRFVAQPLESKPRIFALTSTHELIAVATVAELNRAALDELLAVMNEALWTQDQRALQAAVSPLPATIQHSLLSALPAKQSGFCLAGDFDRASGRPIREIGQMTFSDMAELEIALDAVCDLGFGCRVENELSEPLGFEATEELVLGGRLDWNMQVRSYAASVLEGDEVRGWPLPSGVASETRAIGRTSDAAAYADERGRAGKWVRLHPVWVLEGDFDGLGSMEWIVDVMDALPPSHPEGPIAWMELVQRSD